MTGPDDRVWVDDDGIVVVTGDIDVASSPALDAALRAAELTASGPTGPIVDVAAVGFVDSSGLRALLAASRRAERTGRRVVLRQPGASLQRLLDITGTDVMFDVEPAPS